MANSLKCPHCGHWIGPMQVHEDCERKQEEKRELDTAHEEIARLRNELRLNNGLHEISTIANAMNARLDDRDARELARLREQVRIAREALELYRGIMPNLKHGYTADDALAALSATTEAKETR